MIDDPVWTAKRALDVALTAAIPDEQHRRDKIDTFFAGLTAAGIRLVAAQNHGIPHRTESPPSPEAQAAYVAELRRLIATHTGQGNPHGNHGS